MALRITTVNLPEELQDRIDEVARASERSRSFVIRRLLEQSLSATDRAAALAAVAADGLEQYAAEHAPRERPANPAEVISAASTDGHSRLNALKKIAAGNRKTNFNGER